jgi:hypothetical protein
VKNLSVVMSVWSLACRERRGDALVEDLNYFLASKVDTPERAPVI